MRYRWLVAFALLLVICGSAPAAPVSAVGDAQCFAETGYCIQGNFRIFWEQNGGLRVFGFPISQQLTQTFQGRLLTYQYFERSRFEAYPNEQWQPPVLLGRVGEEVLSLSGIDWHNFPTANTGGRADCTFILQTQHSICGAFRGYYYRFGGLPIFGYPLSDEMPQTLPDGRVITVQWFERAQMQYFSQNPPEYRVQLALLGKLLLNR